ncbi:flavin reductase [Listeria seeligeri]|uniref:flavin reductase n=1 Tax=Listeria seeligeri TaxID=1640 RepID=UPI001887199E|nr:flavin reductase [Listeria seeligeri]MBF2545007.1 flavin reductase [Listeria seeligeri]MBF2641609.1 flavin reductase [Listeria seeligeri]
MFKKMEKDSFYYGFPVVLMTTKDTENNKDNITVISSTWTLGKSIVIGLGLANKGYLNLQVGSEATFNVADATIWENIELIAKTTGNFNVPDFKKQAGYEYCTDKFSLGGFTKMAGKEVQSVRIQECPIQIETSITELSIRSDFAIIECEIKGIFVDEKILYDDSHIDVNNWSPLIYKFREYTTANQSLGTNFRFQEFKD